jgi:hypothetical protein
MRKSISFHVLAFGLLAGMTLHAQALNLAVPQASPALTIPHKAMVSASELVNPSSNATGAVSLVLRLYAQQTSGAPLFEERQTVTVQNGSYLAFIGSATPGGIPASIYNAHGTFWIEAVPTSAPNSAVARVPFTLRRDASTPVGTDSISLSFAVDPSVCYTCGGAWPIFTGMITSAGHATERGVGCGGVLTYSVDSSPYICSR